MKPLIFSLQSLMDSHGVALADRGPVAYTAAAQAIAYHLAVPSTKVENPYGYFLEKYREEVCNLLDEINEAFVIRVAEALELTKQLWVFRYYLVYDPFNPSVVQAIDVIARSGDRHLAPTYSALIGKYPYALAQATAVVTDAVAPQGG